MLVHGCQRAARLYNTLVMERHLSLAQLAVGLVLIGAGTAQETHSEAEVMQSFDCYDQSAWMGSQIGSKPKPGVLFSLDILDDARDASASARVRFRSVAKTGSVNLDGYERAWILYDEHTNLADAVITLSRDGSCLYESFELDTTTLCHCERIDN